MLLLVMCFFLLTYIMAPFVKLPQESELILNLRQGGDIVSVGILDYNPNMGVSSDVFTSPIKVEFTKDEVYKFDRMLKNFRQQTHLNHPTTFFRVVLKMTYLKDGASRVFFAILQTLEKDNVKYLHVHIGEPGSELSGELNTYELYGDDVNSIYEVIKSSQKNK